MWKSLGERTTSSTMTGKAALAREEFPGRILLVLESVLNHGSDWEVVAQNVMTKSKLDCIVKFIELPFGEFILGRINGLQRSSVDNKASTTYHISLSANMLDASVPEQQSGENTGGTEQNTNMNEDVVQGPPPKMLRAGSIDNIASLKKQVALISSTAAPTIAAFAADSAVSAICQETLCSREIFDAQEEYLKKGTSKNVGQIVDTEVDNTVTPASHDQASIQEVNFMPLKARVTTATALGAAAAHANLLMEQEERELEHLMADIIEMQMKKFQDKIKHFEELESLMEKEHANMDEPKEFVVLE